MKEETARPANEGRAGTAQPDIGLIYKQHQAELKGFIAKRVSLQEDVEDILQNVFYQLSRIDLIENPIEQISAWLYSVTRNQIIDRQRKHKEERLPEMKRNSDDEFLLDISEILSDTDDDPETVYLRSLVWDELEAALSELPEEQRVVFELNELQDFSFKEISETTGIPVNTLISRKRYAVLHLRQRLQNLYKEITGTD